MNEKRATRDGRPCPFKVGEVLIVAEDSRLHWEHTVSERYKIGDVIVVERVWPDNGSFGHERIQAKEKDGQVIPWTALARAYSNDE